jgi:hypothetical protein
MTTGPLAASEGILDVAVVAGPPEAPKGPTPERIGNPVLVDIKVGDVNGKPVFASKFLEPMAERLRQKALEYQKKGTVLVTVEPGRQVRMNWRDAWRFEAQQSIDRGLLVQIKDELLRAEAIASFTPEMKQGFLAYMEGFSKRLQSENMGSRTAANQKLQEQGGLDQVLKSRAEMELVNFQLEQKLRRKVNISWREVKLEYARKVATWEANGKVLIRRVEIRGDDTASVEKFKGALAAGKSFAELAGESYNLNRPDVGGLEVIDPKKPEFFGGKDLDQAAKALDEGETVGPITVGKYLDWVHRDPDPTRSGPLYKEQDRIHEELWAKRFNEEGEKYLQRLRAKTTITSIPEMSARLLEIAEDRYLPKKAS